MPFLDHLEELRWKILWSVAALIVGSIIGFFLVQHFDVLGLLKEPIAVHLPEGKLFVTRPTDAFLITLKLALVVGFVLAAPVIIWQLWSFVSPALYESEKRYIIPALVAGLGLFVAGAFMAYQWVLPAVLKILLTYFQREDLEFIITANEYFGFATQIILAFGIVFQTPLLMTLVSALGLLGPAFFSRNRAYALVIAALLSALLTPPDLFSMLIMMLPVLLLYELGIIMSRLVWKRSRRNRIAQAALILIALAGSVEPVGAQQPPLRPPKKDSTQVRRDSALVARPLLSDTSGTTTDQPVDTTGAMRLGLPPAPSRSFPSADSTMLRLMRLEGYRVTRYAGDSIALHALTKEIDLTGSALVDRDGSVLEADTVRFQEEECRLFASGAPKLFNEGSVLVGAVVEYDTCENRGIVETALTSFNQSGVTWYLRGGLGVDSGSTRLYSGDSDLTTCDLPDPHYHFAARSVKWVSNTVMVARPVVLYVRDIPILWLPFMFQDMRKGRRSGWLVPRFGLNDLVRTSSGYNRHVANVGYYVALNDYLDVQASFDWFSSNYFSVNGQLRYQWLNRFIGGGVSVSRISEFGQEGQGGSRSLRLVWNHQQSFDMRTRLTANVDYATSVRVLERNAVDPFLSTAEITSAINFNKQYDWGTLTIGGNRRQSLTDPLVREVIPSITLTPVPMDLSESVTWSPSFSLQNQRVFNQQGGSIELPPVDGSPRLDTLLVSTRRSAVQIRTPLRVGRWNWQNSFTINDFISNQRRIIALPDSADSTVSNIRYYGSEFTTEIDWNTGINLPLLFPSTWKLQPSVNIRNSTSGPFLLRNAFTGGGFVRQGKRLSFNASLAPSLFGFLPGIGPLSRIRHSVSPRVQWNYAPPAGVPEDYARAIDPAGTRPELRSLRVHGVSFSLSQTFEGKMRLPEGDTADTRNARKIKLLSVQTSALAYDFEQAKQTGRTGWTTASITNTFTSDLLRGFSLRTLHDLWDGPVGDDTTRFDPFLKSVSARFSVSAATIAGITRLLGGRGAQMPQATEAEEEREMPPTPAAGRFGGPLRQPEQVARGPGRTRPFSASISYDDQRSRPTGDDQDQASQARRNLRTLGLAVAFSLTLNWSLSWNTQYNITAREFGQHVLRLDRDLHRWRATFSFIKSPNGNVAFNFFVSLLDQPDIKFQFDQRTISR